jgi:hypothetical protein
LKILEDCRAIKKETSQKENKSSREEVNKSKAAKAAVPSRKRMS